MPEQFCRYLQQKFPDAEFKVFNIALKIKKLEKEKKDFQEIIGEISAADAVLWAFPLYFFLVSLGTVFVPAFLQLINNPYKSILAERYIAQSLQKEVAIWESRNSLRKSRTIGLSCY